MKQFVVQLLYVTLFVLIISGCAKPPKRDIPITFKDTYPVLFTDANDFNEIFALERQIILSERKGFLLGQHPQIIVGTDGRFLIYDRYTTRRCYLLDSSGSFVREIGSNGRGPGEYIEAYDTQFDRDGKIYIFSTEGKLIRYTSTGEYDNATFMLGNPFTQFQFDAAKNIYMYAIGIVTRKGSTEGTVVKYDPEGKELVRFAPHPKSFTPAFQREGGGIVIDRTGLIYHASPYEYRIQVFNENGKLLDSFGDIPSDWKASEKIPTAEIQRNMRDARKYELSNSTVGRIQLLNNDLILLFRMTPETISSRKHFMDIYSLNGAAIMLGIVIPYLVSHSFVLNDVLYVFLPAGLNINGRKIEETLIKQNEHNARIQIYRMKR
ncbi:MAG: 6-bladed beta-propeller [bacterium]